ncbi:MAG TPA: MGMT family protein [Candidatus Nanoarchaeia archaeon]|nr:MGMT family protein [Candidatus Nanoarchaeia archaeon]
MATTFATKVYELCSNIPPGKVSTYGAIALVLNSSPRAVGQALRCNPFAPKVPCHRVVASDGRIGGFMGMTRGKEIARKIQLLKEEGVVILEGKILAFEQVRVMF